MKNFRLQFHKLRMNLGQILRFEAGLKLFLAVVLIPSFYLIFFLMMRLSGYRYLTAENARQFVRSPVFWVGFLLMMLLVTAAETIDFCAAKYFMEMTRYGRKADSVRCIRFALGSGKRMLRKGNRIALLLVLSGSILFSSALLPSLLKNIQLTAFLVRRSRNPVSLAISAAAVYALLWIVFLRYRYVLPVMILEGSSFREALRKNSRLAARHRLRDFLEQTALQGLFYAAYTLLVMLEVFLAVFFSRLLYGSGLAGLLTGNLILVLMAATVIIFTLSSPTIACFLLCVQFYRNERETGERHRSLPMRMESRSFGSGDRRTGRVMRIGLIAAVLLGAGGIYRYARGDFNPRVEYVHKMEITAHRGASRFFPENTMAAFRGAAKQGADWIELDIHQSRDRQIFVMHDPSFERVAGVRRYAWELTYSQIEKLDAGSYFSSKFRGERIPLLSEVIDYAKENQIRLNIEIKPSPYEKGIERRLVKLLEEYDFEKKCVVTSQSYASLQKIRKLNPKIRTIYVMSYAYGQIDRLKSADGFSVRYTSVDRNLVARLHNSGREILAWTVNSRYDIQEMIDCQADNIITDNVLLAKKEVAEEKAGDAMNRYIRILREIL